MTGPKNSTSPVVAFDLDGTLTWTGVTTPFLRALAGRRGFWAGVLKLAPAAALFAVGASTRAHFKERVLTEFLPRHSAEHVRRTADAFADETLDHLMRPDAAERLGKHKDDGARAVIVTACPEPIAAPIAARLGVELVATKLEESNGRFTGSLNGDNCRGAEKIRRLRALIGEGGVISHAYGDSAGDDELVAIAEDAGYRVFRDGPAAPGAAALRLLL